MEVKTGSIEERIINASFDILEKEGISKATTKKIAEQANVSEVTLFRKFKTKQKLIEVAKNHYSNYIIEKLDEIFKFNNQLTIEEYLKSSFYEVVNLSNKELNIIKVGMEEVRDIPTERKLVSKMADNIINKLSEFFKIKIEQNEIRQVNPNILALNIYSIIFESIILWKVYGKRPLYSIDKYIDDFLDIILNGIKVEV